MTLRKRTGWGGWGGVDSLLSSFRGARSASPESILPIVVMDSGPAPRGASRNDEDLRRQWHGPGVVAGDPVGIGPAAEPGIRPRRLLDTRSTIFAARLEPSKRIRHAVASNAIEAARQHCGVLDRHRGPLRHIGRH